MTSILAMALAMFALQSGVLSGRIQSPEGEPAAGVRVFALPVDARPTKNGDLRVEAITQTDNAGRFSLEGLPAGRYYVAAGPLELMTLYPGVTNIDAARPAIAGSETGPLDFKLDKFTADLMFELKYVPRDPGSIPSSGIKVTSATKLERGMRLQVQYGDTWWAARILEMQSDGRIKIHYIGWSSASDEIVTRSKLQLDDKVIEKTQVFRDRQQEGPEMTEKGAVPFNAGPIESTGVKVTAKTPLQLKQVLQVEQGKAFWAVRIIELLPDDRVRIHYLGWSAGNDEVVPRSRLQLDDKAIEKTQRQQQSPELMILDMPVFSTGSLTIDRMPSAQLAITAVISVADVEMPYQVRFSKDGRRVRVFSTKTITTYDTSTGAAQQTINVLPTEAVVATSIDGSRAILTAGEQAILLNVETRRRQTLPAAWRAASGEISISGDGRLLGVYSNEGEGADAMVVDVYDLEKRAHVARRASDLIAAGGAFGGGVSEDGRFVEFTNNRAGAVLVDLKSGRPGPAFPGPLKGFKTIRSSDGAWVVQVPEQGLVQDQPLDVTIRDGATGLVRGWLAVKLAKSEHPTLAFCGDRVVLGRRNAVTAHALPSGVVIARQKTFVNAGDEAPLVACAPTGRVAATVSGSTMTLLRIP